MAETVTANQTQPEPQPQAQASPYIQANEDTFAKGLLELLSPVVLECDERINDVLASQADLSQQIDLLTNGTCLPNSFVI